MRFSSCKRYSWPGGRGIKLHFLTFQQIGAAMVVIGTPATLYKQHDMTKHHTCQAKCCGANPSESICHILPRPPHKSSVTVTKCHAFTCRRANRWPNAPPDPSQFHQCDACHPKGVWLPPRASSELRLVIRIYAGCANIKFQWWYANYTGGTDQVMNYLGNIVNQAGAWQHDRQQQNEISEGVLETYPDCPVWWTPPNSCAMLHKQVHMHLHAHAYLYIVVYYILYIYIHTYLLEKIINSICIIYVWISIYTIHTVIFMHTYALFNNTQGYTYIQLIQSHTIYKQISKIIFAAPSTSQLLRMKSSSKLEVLGAVV